LLGLSSPLQLPDGAPEALREQWSSLPPRLLETDAAGRFVFDGLRPDWRGTLIMASSHWLLPDEAAAKEWRPRHLELERPQQDLVLRTTMLPTVRGRVVWDDNGEPVTSGYVGVDGKCAGERGATGSAAIGPGGRFAVGLEPGAHEQLGWLDAASRPSMRSADVVVHAVPGGVPFRGTIADAALGSELELRMQREPTTFFLVTDELERRSRARRWMSRTAPERQPMVAVGSVARTCATSAPKVGSCCPRWRSAASAPRRIRWSTCCHLRTG
jgi:hypothetical protein